MSESHADLTDLQPCMSHFLLYFKSNHRWRKKVPAQQSPNTVFELTFDSAMFACLFCLLKVKNKSTKTETKLPATVPLWVAHVGWDAEPRQRWWGFKRAGRRSPETTPSELLIVIDCNCCSRIARKLQSFTNPGCYDKWNLVTLNELQVGMEGKVTHRRKHQSWPVGNNIGTIKTSNQIKLSS